MSKMYIYIFAVQFIYKFIIIIIMYKIQIVHR